MNFFAGVDGGGTGTRVMIASGDGQIISVGTAGPSNPNHVGKKGVSEALETAFADAWNRAQLKPQPLTAVFLGLAGVHSIEDQEMVRSLAFQLPGTNNARIGVDHDIRTSLAGGLAGKPGIAIIAGTGSSGFGRNQRGETFQCGGWGALLDDVGSGYWIGVQAMMAAVRASDGRLGETKLTRIVFDFLQVSQCRDIPTRIHQHKMERFEIARLAPMVIEAALHGDSEAQRIVKLGASELAGIAASIGQRLFPNSSAPVVFTGGLAKDDFYRMLMARAMSQSCPSLKLVSSQYSPLAGALLLALKENGKAPSSAVMSAAAVHAPVK